MRGNGRSDVAEVGEGAEKGGNNLIQYTQVRNPYKKLNKKFTR